MKPQLCACGCGKELDPNRRRKNSVVLRGHYHPVSRANLAKAPPPTEKFRQAAYAKFKTNPLMQRGIKHVNGKVWRLRSPDNVVYEFKNLREFCRKNPHLFDPEDVAWKKTVKGDYNCRACMGIAALSDRNTKNQRGTWKGWTWHSQTERLFNEGKDLLERIMKP